jgi:ATP-dependent RNA helicase HelY
MSTPAERYAAARARQSEQRSPLGRFVAGLPFELDDFQLEACRAVAAGHGVLVAAPTGAGKTVIGEYAIFHALQEGRKAFYTTPIKALSNQKYGELVAVHGPDRVGLLTGDVSINGEAPVVVMTTEVLRNMIYAGSPTLRGLGWVVMDEVHYLADRFRGAVWEEVIIHLPDDVTLVSLSATVSNAEEFGDWLATVRGDTRVVVSEHRPVPLWQHVLVDRRLHDLFVDPEGDPVLGLPGEERVTINPELVALAAGRSRAARRGARTHGRDRARPRRSAGPSRVSVIETLDRHALLPGIVFVFSRAGCDAAVSQCLASGVRLTTPGEREAIRDVVTERAAALPPGDLAVLGFTEWSQALERSRLTTPGCCRSSRRPSRRCSSEASSRSSSRRRRWRWASTCRPARWSWSASSSGTARATPTSRPGSTPSSPAAPGGAASTSRGTRWSCGPTTSTPSTSRGWRRPGPTRCAPASGPRTRWR